MTVAGHDMSLCIACGTCVNTCPRDVFRLNKDFPSENGLGKSVIAYPRTARPAACATCTAPPAPSA